MAINKVTLLGNVGRKPEIRQGNNGQRFATFSLATTDKGYTRQDGSVVQERTEWHNIVANGKIVDVIESYVNAGMKLYIEGKLRTRKYTDRNNIERTTTEIVLDVMEMCGGGNSQQAQQTQPQPQAQQSYGGYQQQSYQQPYRQSFQPTNDEPPF